MVESIEIYKKWAIVSKCKCKYSVDKDSECVRVG